jgi:hypothetical protein
MPHWRQGCARAAHLACQGPRLSLSAQTNTAFCSVGMRRYSVLLRYVLVNVCRHTAHSSVWDHGQEAFSLMIRVFPPPGSYQAGHCTDDLAPSSNAVLRGYPLSGSTSLDGGDPLWSSTSSFLYESSLVTVTLGRRMWGLRQPAYGFNGIVQGAIN